MNVRRRRVWTVPVLLGLASGGGLVTALVGDGAWHALSSLCLAAPVVVAAWCWQNGGTKR